MLSLSRVTIVIMLLLSSMTAFANNSFITAPLIPLPGAKPDRLNTTLERDYFRFKLTVRGTVTIQTFGTTDTAGVLYSDRETALGTDNNSGEGRNFKIRAALAPGTYYIQINAFEPLGAYQVAINFSPSDDHSDNVFNATSVAPNSRTFGTLDVNNVNDKADFDLFRIDLSEPGRLLVQTMGTTDTQASLYRSVNNGVLTKLAIDQDNGAGTNFFISQPVTAGAYLVAVSGNNGALGNYILRSSFFPDSGPEPESEPEPTPEPVTDDHGNSRLSATAIELNTMTRGNLETEGDTDFFGFVLPSSGTVRLQTSLDTNTVGTLFNGAGFEIARDTNSGVDRNFLISESLPAGSYFLRVSGFALPGILPPATGIYNLSFRFTADPVEDDHGDAIETATSINPNSLTPGFITQGLDLDFFEIVLPSSGTLLLSTSGATDTYGTLNNSMLNQIDFSDGISGPNFSITQNLPAGTYYVIVRGFDETISGDYTLSSTFVADNFYDTETKRLTLPVVQVGSKQFSAVLEFNGQTFTLLSATLIPGGNGANTTSFDSSNGQLSIPVVTAGSNNFSVILQRQGTTGFVFTLLQLTRL